MTAQVPDKTSSGPRGLLRLLRDLMKGAGGQRLDQVVQLIAQDLSAEVCSLYVIRPGKVLELAATQGLKPEAVRRTRLRVGEGLVGQIAAQAIPFALAKAQDHPAFAYRPETGEEVYQSLVGVPLLRLGHVTGVLVVQNRTARYYSDEEVEALETVAMVLAESLAGGALAGEADLAAEDQSPPPQRLVGQAWTEGLAIGTAVPHQRGIVISQVVADDPAAEQARLLAALEEMRNALDGLLARSDLAVRGEHQEVLETYRMFADDRGWVGRLQEAVQSGLTAEAAVERIQNDTRARMAKIKDPYLRERLADLEDLGNRLLHHLLGLAGVESRELPEDMVLVARELGPAELLDYDRDRLRAVVLEEGSPTSHVAIVARALNLPLIGRCAGILTQTRHGDRVIVDGEHRQVLLRPGEAVLQNFADSLEARERRQAAFAATKDLPAITRDGQKVSLQINAGLLIDLPQLDQTGAEGIGLYRTEIPFMVRDSLPNVAEQSLLYAQVLDHAGDRPVVFRTLDIGGDKVLPYWRQSREENPAMGWRAIRIGLDRPALLRGQLRALIRASAGRSLRVMFPMISAVSELAAARALLDRELEREQKLGGDLPRDIMVGTMLEVPALLWQLPALFARCDFVSIGSNDLLQFLFASDRGNSSLAQRYDFLSPAVLNLFRSLATEAKAAGCSLSICGESAGEPLEAMALIGCGFRQLSMTPARVPVVRSMVRSLEAAPLEKLIDRLISRPDRSLRAPLSDYARDNGVDI